MNRKGKSLNKQCFYQNKKIFCGIKSYNTCLNAVLISALTQAHNRFAAAAVVYLHDMTLVYCTVDGTLFEVGPEIRDS